MRIRVIDLETTGLEPTDKVVEIAACDLLDGVVQRIHAAMIQPDIAIPTNLSAIHHIIDDDVLGAPPWPDGAHDVLGTEFREVGYDAPDAYAAHNARFERQWVTDALVGAKPWICTYKSALRVWPEAPGHSNQELRYWLRPDGLLRETARDTHRAGPDAYVTAFLLREILNRVSFDQCVAWTREPALLPRINFGKHRGSSWKDLPVDYLGWMLRQGDMNEDVKFCARTEMERRRA